MLAAFPFQKKMLINKNLSVLCGSSERSERVVNIMIEYRRMKTRKQGHPLAIALSLGRTACIYKTIED